MGVSAGYCLCLLLSAAQICNAKYSHSPAGDDRDISDGDVLSVLDTRQSVMLSQLKSNR